MRSTLALVLLFIITLVLLCFMSDHLAAQNSKSDSLKRLAFSRDSLKQDSIADIAKVHEKGKLDARSLKLGPGQRQIFDANKQNSNSDFFKPTMALASAPELLKDSVYVKAFRQAAYNKALNYRKRTVGHYILIGGIVAVSAGIIFVLIEINYTLSGGGFGHR